MIYAAARLQAQSSGQLLIEHVSVIDVLSGDVTSDVTVEIRGSLIERIGPEPQRAADATIIDGSGKFLIPGLWDMHVHLREAEQSFRTLIANGITSARIMYSGLSLADYAEWRKNPHAVRIAAGGFVKGSSRTVPPGAVAVRDEEEDGRLAVRRLLASGADFIELDRSVPRKAYFGIADETRRRGVNFAGPVPGSVTPAEAAKAAQLSVEGLATSYSSSKLMETFADDGVFETPLLVSATTATLKRNQKSVRDMQRAGVHLLAGSDAGAVTRIELGESLHRELELFVSAGLTSLEALQTATRNPALYFGTLTLMGTVEKGKSADLVLLDANPLEDIRNARKINAVLVRGKYYSREALDSFQKLPAH